MNKRIYLSSPTMHGEEMKYIQEAFDTNWVAPLGKNVDEFENEMASYIGIKDAAALVSGTSALHLALKLCNVQRGDIVFCSDLTFSATVNPVSYEDAAESLGATYKGKQTGTFGKYSVLSLVVLKNRTSDSYTGIRSGGSKAA